LSRALEQSSSSTVPVSLGRQRERERPSLDSICSLLTLGRESKRQCFLLSVGSGTNQDLMTSGVIVVGGSPEDLKYWQSTIDWESKEFWPIAAYVIDQGFSRKDAAILVESPHADTSTARDRFSSHDKQLVADIIRTIFSDAVHEEFEAGMESRFARRLIAVLERYGDDAAAAIEGLFQSESIGADLVVEAVRTLGRMRDPATSLARFRLLLIALRHSSPIVRDQAALALVDTQGPAVIGYLKEAASRERYKALREDFEQLVVELEGRDDAARQGARK